MSLRVSRQPPLKSSMPIEGAGPAETAPVAKPQESGAAASDVFAQGGSPPPVSADRPVTPLQSVPLGNVTSAKPAAKHPAVMPAQSFFINPPKWTPPVDFNHKVPDAVKQLYPIFSPQPPKNGGEFNSRFETESKLAVPLEHVDNFRDKLEQLVNDPKLVESVFGKGWTLTRSDRYFEGNEVEVKDAQGNPALDEHGQPLKKKELTLDENGRPIGKVMRDVYYDDDNMNLAKSRSVLRFREFEGDKFNMVNFKPGFGRWDGNIISRIEYAILVAPGIKEDPAQLAEFFESDEHLNFFRFAYDIAPGINARELKPRLDNADTRYRYILEHKDSLTEIEISLDHVKGSARDVAAPDGKPKEAEFAQFEMEVAHTNIKGESWDLSNPDQAKLARERLEWATANGLLPKDGQFQPQIHVPDDVNNKPIRETDSYKRFSKAVDAMTEFMYGNEVPVVRGEQKGRKIAELTGVIPEGK